VNKNSWLKLMDGLSIGTNLSTFEELTSAYAESHRHYHTSTHIDACLELFERHRQTAGKPAELECAIWFHDAIYKPLGRDNELKSADWAARFLRDNACSGQSQDNVRKLILATAHDSPATDSDTQLLVDIDLSILGVDEAAYDLFEENVRREYRLVPAPLYRRGRRNILESFLARKPLYLTPSIRDEYETQARVNLERAIRRLQ